MIELKPQLKDSRLNLGCGGRYRTDWTNADLLSDDATVLSVDLRRRLPFEAHRFAAVYHSHVLEHLERSVGQAMLCECFRILGPGGILRVVVPDLELMARWYLEATEQAAAACGTASASADGAEALRHRWAAACLVDQCARDASGGELLRIWQTPERLSGDAWLAPRAGLQMLGRSAMVDGRAMAERPASRGSVGRRSVSMRLYESLIKRLLGRAEYQALRVGRFRLDGETHKFMYDRISLRGALEHAGFVDITAHRADTSGIPSFDPVGLDTELAGEVYKPESLFFEGRKPGAA